MSLAEVTSRCFQAGITAQKWARMCNLVKTKSNLPVFESQCQLSNAILELYGPYPSDLLLYSYLQHALHNFELLSLPIFVITFLEAAKSPSLHDTSTLNMLCRLIHEEHFASGLPPAQSLLNAHDSLTPKVLEVVHGALDLLRVSYSLQVSSFHKLVLSATQLLMHLLSCVEDMTSVTATQAMRHYEAVAEILQIPQLDQDLRTVLNSFALSLSMIWGDDAKMAQEAQQMQTLQLSLGKGDILGPNSQSDIVTCSLVLRHLVENRTTACGSGTPMAIAALVATFRWTSWTPKVFYTQLFLAATSILAQSSVHRDSAFIWRSFIITRLTHLLSDLEQVLSTEPMSESDWRGATQAALLNIQSRTDLLSQCDKSTTLRDLEDISMDLPDSGGRTSSTPPPFFTILVQYCAHRTNLIDNVTRMLFKTTIEPSLDTLLTSDAQESGVTLESYIESRLVSDANSEEGILSFLRRALEDVPNHSQFAKIIQKRVEMLCLQYDVENLGILCKAFNSEDIALDIISLHIKFDDFLAPILAFVDGFDCESVGDPQTAVGHLGNVVLFLQATLVKYQLSSHTFTLGGRTLQTDYLLSTSTVYRMSALGEEDINAMKAWPKALFDTNSEGIEDNILRTTKPKTLMKLAATVVLQASNACADRRMEAEIFRNGVSYFTGPLLNWTLVGGIKALLRDILEKDFNAPVHMEVLQTLVESPSCPQTVLKLTGHGILALVSDPKASLFEKKVQNSPFKTASLRAIASKALGIPTEADQSLNNTLSIPTHGHWLDQPRKAIRDALTTAREGKAPAFDVGRCVSVLGPTRFLRLFWDELHTFDLELGRRLASYVLLCAPAAVGAGAGRTPPLLPIFLGGVLHGLLARLDAQPPAMQTFGIELLVAVISSALMGLLHTEWALRAIAADPSSEPFVFQPSVSVARRLAADLKRSRSPSAVVIVQRLSSSPSFVGHFPMMAA